MHRLRRIYHDYPNQFWLLMLAAFIDRIGGTLVFPFFSLYITDKFDVGLTQAGYVFTIFAVTGMMGGFVGGAMADKLGRKGMVIFGLVASASTSMLFGFVDELALLYGVAVIAGLFSSVGGPAVNSMVADILPEEKHSEGYGMFRVVINVAFMIGPIVGGILATRSYLLLFILDGVTSVITALIVFFAIRETQSKASAEANRSTTIAQTFRGYGKVLQDRLFVGVMLLVMIAQLVYLQMYCTLPVYLRDSHDIPSSGYGLLMSINATMVVFLQLGLTRRLRGYPPLLMLGVACIFYMIGYGMYGFVGVFILFAVAMAFITVGEMVFFPIAQAVVAQLAPEAMRGRYMAMFEFAFAIPSSFATVFAGLVIDNTNPNIIWYLCIVLGAVGAISFVSLHRVHPIAGTTEQTTPTPTSDAPEIVAAAA